MCREVLQSRVLQVDATTVKYIDPAIKGKAKQGTMWSDHGDLQCDAHSVYDGIFAPVDATPDQPVPIEVGCWAHASRKFYDAREQNKEAFTVLDWIGNLYKLDDGCLEIDNNGAERVLRMIAMGRKNWLFYGSERGGHTGAVMHLILASAKRNGLNEFTYLCDVLNRLADLNSEAELHNLLPDRWKPRT